MDEFLVSTTSLLEGYKIVRYHGIVTGHVVAGTNIFVDFFASVSDVFGGRSIAYKRELEAIGDEVVREVTDKALRLGATGVIGLRVDHDELSGGGKSMLMVTASGTAVSLRPVAIKGVESDGIGSNAPTLDGRALADLLESECLIQRAANGHLSLTQDEWEVLIRNRISELAPAVLEIFSSAYDHETAFRTGVEDLGAYIQYFSVIPREAASDALFQRLEKESGTLSAHGIVKIIDKAGLVEFERVAEFLKSSDLKMNHLGVELLSCTKRAYVPADLRLLRESVDLAKESLSDRASELKAASGMSGRDRRRAAKARAEIDKALEKVSKASLVSAALARAFGESGNEQG